MLEKIYLKYYICLVFLILIFSGKSVLSQDGNEIKNRLLKDIQNNKGNLKFLDSLADYVYINYQRDYPDILMDVGYYFKELAKKNDGNKFAAWSYLLLGTSHNQKGNITQAVYNLELAIQKFRELSDYENMGNSYNQLGIAYLRQGNNKLSANYFLQSYDIFKKNNLRKKLFAITNNLGNLYLRNNPSKALDYFNNSLQLMSKYNIKEQRLNVFINIARAYMELKNYNEAAIFLNKAFREKDLKESGHYQFLINFYSGNLSYLKGNFEQSIAFYSDAHTYEQYAEAPDNALLHVNFGRSYYYKNYFAKALLHFRLARYVSEKYNLTQSLDKSNKGLAETFDKLGIKDSAYFYMNIYAKSKEDNYLLELDKETQQLLFRYDMDTKELKMQKLLIDSKEADVKFKNLIIIATLVIILILLIFVTIIFRAYRRNLNLSERLKTEIKLNSDYHNELKIAKESIEESNNFKSAIIRNMTHEIRTPFNGLLGFVSLIHKRAEELNDEEMIEYTQLVEISSRRVYELITNLNDLALLESNDYQIRHGICYLPDIINEVYFAYLNTSTEKGLDLTIGNIDDIVFVSDAGALAKALKNVVDNSFKFTLTGYVKLSTLLTGNHLEIVVEDTGIGVTADNLENIGIPFKQIDMSISRSYEGIGVGLAVTAKILQMLNGKLDFKSTFGKGTTVAFKFDNINIKNDLFEDSELSQNIKTS